VFTQGASALGQANAVVAHHAEPTSLFFNPALLEHVPGIRLEAGTTAIFSDLESRTDRGGETTRDEGGAHFPSTLYLTQALGERVSGGLGVFFPFGPGTEWRDDGEGRTLAARTAVTSYVVNPAVSVRVGPQLSVAAGVDFL